MEVQNQIHVELRSNGDGLGRVALFHVPRQVKLIGILAAGTDIIAAEKKRVLATAAMKLVRGVILDHEGHIAGQVLNGEAV